MVESLRSLALFVGLLGLDRSRDRSSRAILVEVALELWPQSLAIARSDSSSRLGRKHRHRRVGGEKFRNIGREELEGQLLAGVALDGRSLCVYIRISDCHRDSPPGRSVAIGPGHLKLPSG